MKYLKLYERIYWTDENRLEKFCKDYLIYLIDDGFKLLLHNQGYNKINIRLKRGDDSNFKWDDISSDFIPLIEVLNQQQKTDNLKFKLTYTLVSKKHIHIKFGGSGVGYLYNVERVLNDDIDNKNKNNIKEINFTVVSIK